MSAPLQAVTKIEREIEAMMQQAEAQLQTFVEKQIQSMADKAKQHEEAIAEDKENLAELNMRKSDVEGKRKELSEAALTRKQKLRQEAGGMPQTERSVAEQEQALQDELDALRIAIQAAEDDIPADYDAQVKSKECIEASLRKYEERLALTFKREINGSDKFLKFVFTQIDPENPTREFSVTLNTVSFDVVECNPVVEGLEVMAKMLKEDEDGEKLGYFLRSLRRKFYDVC